MDKKDFEKFIADNPPETRENKYTLITPDGGGIIDWNLISKDTGISVEDLTDGLFTVHDKDGNDIT